jgi:hypothetical protein
MPSLPHVDMFNKVQQQLKCMLAAARTPTSVASSTLVVTTTPTYQFDALAEAIDLIDHCRMNVFSKENNAKLYALRGQMYSLANRCASVCVCVRTFVTDAMKRTNHFRYRYKCATH